MSDPPPPISDSGPQPPPPRRPDGPEAPAVLVDETGRVADEGAFCLRCGYAIRGQAADGACPECGAAIAHSLHGSRLRSSDRRYVRRLHFGVTLLLAGILANVLLGLLAGVGGFVFAFAGAAGGGLQAVPAPVPAPTPGGPAAPTSMVAPADARAGGDVATAPGAAAAHAVRPMGDEPGDPGPGVAPGTAEAPGTAKAPGTAEVSGAGASPDRGEPPPAATPGDPATSASTAGGPRAAPAAPPVPAAPPDAAAAPPLVTPTPPAPAGPDAWIRVLSIGFVLAGTALELLILLGWWLFTEPDPALPASARGDGPRRVIRGVVILAAASAVVNMAISGNLTNPGFALAGGLTGGTLLMIGFSGMAELAKLARFFASMLYLQWLAPRLPDEVVERRARLYMWLLPVIAVVGACVLVGPLIASALSWLLLFRVRRGIGAVLERMPPDDTGANGLAAEPVP